MNDDEPPLQGRLAVWVHTGDIISFEINHDEMPRLQKAMLASANPAISQAGSRAN
jgi:hypothetical protein